MKPTPRPTAPVAHAEKAGGKFKPASTWPPRVPTEPPPGAGAGARAMSTTMRKARRRKDHVSAASAMEVEGDDRVVTPPSPPGGYVTEAPMPRSREFEVNGQTFSVARNFSLIKAVGSGAYGVVWCAAAPTPLALRAKAIF